MVAAKFSVPLYSLVCSRKGELIRLNGASWCLSWCKSCHPYPDCECGLLCTVSWAEAAVSVTV